MSGLFQKINTLLKARIDNFLEEDLRLSRQPDENALLTAGRLGKDVDQEVAALRQRIEEALNYEDALQEKMDALRQEASDLDREADDALRRGQEDMARRALDQMRRLQQQAHMIEADLVQHRRTTAEFIERVNVLEGLIAEARHKEDAGVVAEPPAETLDRALQTARQDAEAPGRAEPVRVIVNQPSPDAETPAPSANDDLAARRARLARRSPEQEE